MADERTAYLFLLRHPSQAARRAGVKLLREHGATVVAQYGVAAIEALATPEQARAAAEAGLFAGQSKNAIGSEALTRLNDEQQQVVRQWNVRFTPRYRRAAKDRTERGRSWGDPDRAAPLPYADLDPEDFKAVVARWEEETGRRLFDEVKPSKARRRGKQAEQSDEEGATDRLSAEEFVRFKDALVDRYEDETFAHRLAGIAYRLDGPWRDAIRNLPDDLIIRIRDLLFAEAACWKMTGEMSVGIVFVESSLAGGPKFTPAERTVINQEIIDGLNWLASEHPAGNLSWVYDTQNVRIDVANGAGDPNEDYWRDPAMAQVNYNGTTYSASWSSVADYREDMRMNNLSEHAFVIFVTPYANSWHAYAGGGRLTLANKNNWGGWGSATLDTITAHEISHLFGSSDEYTGSGTPCSSCTTLHGCDQIPNGNCGACARPHQACVMDQNTRRLCPWTRAHIGWATLFVELTTADELWAGTDDDVWLDIGDLVWTLDTSGHDDRERNHIDGYPIWCPTLQQADIKRILIRKSPDGFAGGWKLARVRVWFAGQVVCDATVNRWLEDDHRFWVGCTAGGDLVNSLRVRVTTGDVAWAGTDDDVTLTLAGTNWNLDNDGHDDFERGNTDTFDLDPRTGVYRSAIHSITIHKSPDGFAGGWRLGGVEVIANGTTIYSNLGINTWLEDDHRTWSATF